MFRKRDIKKRNRAASFTLEPLEDRLELTAGTVGAAAAGATVQVGLSGSRAGYMAAVDRLEGRILARVDRIDADIMKRTAQFDTAYQSAINDAASSVKGRVAARTKAAPTTAQVDRDYNNLVRNTRKRVDALDRQFNGESSQIARRYGRIDPAVATVNSTAQADVHQALASAGAMLESAARSARARRTAWPPRPGPRSFGPGRPAPRRWPRRPLAIATWPPSAGPSKRPTRPTSTPSRTGLTAPSMRCSPSWRRCRR